MNKKENWLRLIRNDSPGWIGTPWEPFVGNCFNNHFIKDPIQNLSGPQAIFNVPHKDSWGVTWLASSNLLVPAAPLITEENRVLADITEWKEKVVFPTLEGYDWTEMKTLVDSVNREENMLMCLIGSGPFERVHYLMGFEDALCSYLEEPEAAYDLIGAIADWKISHLEKVFQHINPDVIHFHDDWGSKENLFLPPNVWREILKPHMKRIVDFVKSHGALYMHHSDTFCEPIVEDMAEIGIDIWQGAIPENDIVGIQKTLNGRMAIMGGIDDTLIDTADANEDLIRGEVRRCIDTYVPQGYFVPCVPNIMPIYPEVARIVEDEMTSYGKDYFKRNK